MDLNLFGFRITKPKKEQGVASQGFVTPVPEDGSTTVSAGGYFGTYVDLDATSKTESELITRYRQIAMLPECDMAINDIVTDAIANLDNEPPVEIDVDDIESSPKLKNAITNEFKEILKLLDFNAKAHDIFRRWYIDGRIYYQKIVDKTNLKRGIVEMRFIDPRKIKKVRDIKKDKLPNGVEVIKTIDEYFLYNDKGINYNVAFGTSQNTTAGSGIKISPDAISYCHSGLIDIDKNIVIGYLHKAIKPANQLKMMEDAVVIYRLSRAPERRIFYIDVGNLPKLKAEQYLKDIMARYRNKIVYDSSTGEIRDDRKFMSMLEDFWLPRREGGRGTEITTLPGGENLGEMDDVNYFQNKLYQSLNVPVSRLQPSTGINFGRQVEVTRDELKFAKFISRLRNKFSDLFRDLLKTQLLLKGIIVDQDWDVIKDQIYFKYTDDEYFSEAKEFEILRNRIDLLNQMTPYVGLYFSQEYVKKTVLKLSEDDMEEMEQQIEAEPPPMMTAGAPMPGPGGGGGEQPQVLDPSTINNKK
jgi:hypothetical protein